MFNSGIDPMTMDDAGVGAGGAEGVEGGHGMDLLQVVIDGGCACLGDWIEKDTCFDHC